MPADPLELYPLDDRGSFSWLLGRSDAMSRASAAIVLDAGTVLVDPVDAEGLDAELAALPPMIGVATLLDRHQRDAAAIAERRGVPRLTPVALGGDGVHLDGVQERAVIERRGWREALLWLPDRRLLVCSETLGTAGFDLARRGDPLGVHPFARVRPPRSAFAGLDPAVIAVGHGPPLRDAAADELRRVLRRARLDIPRHWLRFGVEAVRASRAARRARR
jgi:hypothetical protein